MNSYNKRNRMTQSKKYIDIIGKVHTYHYDYPISQQKHKPKCPNCYKRTNNVFINHNGKKNVNIGFICHICNLIFIFKKSMVFRIE